MIVIWSKETGRKENRTDFFPRAIKEGATLCKNSHEVRPFAYIIIVRVIFLSYILIIYVIEKAAQSTEGSNCSFPIEADESISNEFCCLFFFQRRIKLRSIDGAFTFIMLFRALTVTFIFIKVKKLLYIYVKQTRIFLFVPQWEKSKQKKKVKEVYVSYLPLTKERNIKKVYPQERMIISLLRAFLLLCRKFALV